MYHYVYRLEHIETNQFYIGSRTSKCHPTLDSYLGSMCTWKPDKTKLRKIILKDDFKTRDLAMIYEAQEIANHIENPLNENYFIPSVGYHTQGCVTVKDKHGNVFNVKVDDDKYLSGEYSHCCKNKLTVKDSNGNFYYVSKNDPRYLSGEFKPLGYNKVTVKDSNGKTMFVDINDSRYINGLLVSVNKNKIVVKDINGNTYSVNINDSRVISGELKQVFFGHHHSDETKQLMREKAKLRVSEKNSQFGTMWICNENTKENKKILRSEQIPDGWIKGRKIKYASNS